MQLTVLKSITSQEYKHVKIRSVFDHFHLSQQVNMGPTYFNQNTCSLVGQLLLQFQLQCPEKKKDTYWINMSCCSFMLSTKLPSRLLVVINSDCLQLPSY